jgi:hypothetical protein
MGNSSFLLSRQTVPWYTITIAFKSLRSTYVELESRLFELSVIGPYGTTDVENVQLYIIHSEYSVLRM